MSERPLLLLDFDGPLNPYQAKTMPAGYRRLEIVEGAKSWSVLLNPQHGVELNALADVFQIVWATSWEHGANRLLAPLLGLPDDLPVIVWPDGARDAAASRRPQSWKTPYVADWVGRRPFVWIDDEVDRHDNAYLSTVAGIGPHLLHGVEPNRGLVRADFDIVREWAAGRPR
jgi:hypothetical protein